LEGSSEAAPLRRRARIRVADDEDGVRAVVARTLQAEGYEILGARHGKEALYYLEQVGGAVDLVITDLVMPVMSGHQLTEELARRYPSIPVIWMSGHPREIEVRHSVEDTAAAFIQKPVPPHVLLQTAAQVLQAGKQIGG
ncbi:MAG TPA: response regulator, partial [Gemmatimonadales bacterium]|nr:response regulator [Gemmatimonadales bacterium]